MIRMVLKFLCIFPTALLMSLLCKFRLMTKSVKYDYSGPAIVERFDARTTWNSKKNSKKFGLKLE